MVHYFEEINRILSDSIKSISDQEFTGLVDDCEKTLKKGHKVIASGLGKNVPVCEKFVGTMTSMGMNASFMHTNSAVHGDLGLVQPGDLVIILSKSGSTAESVYLADHLLKRQTNTWILTFSRDSVLTRKIEKKLVLTLEHEGDQWNIVPNNSTTLNLIVLQAIAMELSRRMGIRLQDFKLNHPGGAIGNALKDV